MIGWMMEHVIEVYAYKLSDEWFFSKNKRDAFSMQPEKVKCFAPVFDRLLLLFHQWKVIMMYHPDAVLNLKIPLEISFIIA